MSNRLDPDQARHFVGPDMGPICLQRLSADGAKSKELTLQICFVQLHILNGGKQKVTSNAINY